MAMPPRGRIFDDVTGGALTGVGRLLLPSFAERYLSTALFDGL